MILARDYARAGVYDYSTQICRGLTTHPTPDDDTEMGRAFRHVVTRRALIKRRRRLSSDVTTVAAHHPAQATVRLRSFVDWRWLLYRCARAGVLVFNIITPRVRRERVLFAEYGRRGNTLCTVPNSIRLPNLFIVRWPPSGSRYARVCQLNR